jgi:hypothetical protein
MHRGPLVCLVLTAFILNQKTVGFPGRRLFNKHNNAL